MLAAHMRKTRGSGLVSCRSIGIYLRARFVWLVGIAGALVDQVGRRSSEPIVTNRLLVRPMRCVSSGPEGRLIECY